VNLITVTFFVQMSLRMPPTLLALSPSVSPVHAVPFCYFARLQRMHSYLIAVGCDLQHFQTLLDEFDPLHKIEALLGCDSASIPSRLSLLSPSALSALRELLVPTISASQLLMLIVNGMA